MEAQNVALLTRVKKFLMNRPVNIALDQFFLIDNDILNFTVDFAKVTKNDRILEVGPGLGFLTEKLAEKAGSVLAIEIDEVFRPYLKNLPSNVEIMYGDAYKLLNDKKFLNTQVPPTKVISSIPYSQAQNMLHNYTNWPWYQGDLVWVAPISFANKVNSEPILGAYFSASVIKEVPSSSFYPQPKTLSALLFLKRIDDPSKTDNFEIFFRRWLYNHEHVKVKNAIREGIINSARDLRKITVTKNQAKTLIKDLEIPESELEKLTNNIDPFYYFEIPKKLMTWYNNLLYANKITVP